MLSIPYIKSYLSRLNIHPAKNEMWVTLDVPGLKVHVPMF